MNRVGGAEYQDIAGNAVFSGSRSPNFIDESPMLANAFSQFVAASVRLEDSYKQLQKDVLDLRKQLSERDCALLDSLAENARIRESLQQILDSMPCGVLVLNDQAEAVLLNPESRRLLGLPFSEDADTEPVKLQSISQISGISFESLDHDGSDSDAIETVCVRSEDEPKWLEIRKRRLQLRSFRGRSSVQVILVVRDVTAQRKAEEEREAVRNAVSLAETMSIIAHEIRNPLASLELFSELIETDGDLRDEWIANLRAGIRRLGGTVNNVLNFKSGDLKMTPTRLDDAVRSALEFANPIALQAGLRIEISTSSETAAVVALNESAIQQVILNLVSNSAKHTPEGGKIAVSFRTGTTATGDDRDALPRSILVDIRDTGSGIRADQIDRVLEPGFSGNGDTPGLGLAVCDRIMRVHGGEIRVQNTAPGAQITLRFPLAELELA